jgi:hypothetical protein
MKRKPSIVALLAAHLLVAATGQSQNVSTVTNRAERLEWLREQTPQPLFIQSVLTVKLLQEQI